MNILLHTLTGLLVLTTLLPLWKNPHWFVRGWDFPRVQLAAIAGTVLLAQVCRLPEGISTAWIPTGLTLLVLGYQAWWIAPYTRFHGREVKPAREDSTDPLKIVSVNVLMTNRRCDDLLNLVGEEEPDLLITLETDQRWEQALNPLERDYPHVLRCPLENLYGMHLYSRLPLEDAKIQFLVEKDVPSMHALVVLPSGRRIRLHCLHPAPPSPTENETSKERDAELIIVGRSVADAKSPVIVTGDLNDVAWSATTRLFRKISGLLDPRVGRGMYNTYHTRFPFFRWPVDHFFHSRDFTLLRLARLRSIGSDHFPVLIEVALEPDEAADQQGLQPDSDDHAEATEKAASKNVSDSEVHEPGE